VSRTPDGFRLRLDDAAEIAARRVVMATGLDTFAHRPLQVAELGRPLAWHSSEVRDLEPFAGRRTAVVGSGQSAIELAALLHEAGAQVEVIARARQIRWLRRSGWLHERSGPIRRVLYPPTDVGPIGLSWLVAMPDAFRRVPPRLGSRIAHRCIRPAASGWLVVRTAGVAMTLGRTVAAAQPSHGGLRLALDDGTSRQVEHLVLATGYRVRVDREGILDEPLVAAVRTVDGAPVLRQGFESSVAGLHFVGAFAAPTFGPVMRFVSGTTFTGHAIARSLATERRRVATAAEPLPALG
jgi:pyridine nucleotide-disulfide oxidoreductase